MAKTRSRQSVKFQGVRLHPAIRFFDLVVSLLLLVLLFPLLLLIALASKLAGLVDRSQQGPLFTVQTRYSQGKPFPMLKFRVLKQHLLASLPADHDRPLKPLEYEPANLTFVGHFLQKVGLDELPQLWNILRGEMTLVGPRPPTRAELREEVRRGLYRKLVVKAGLTGPGQQIMKGTRRTQAEEIARDEAYISLLRQGNLVMILRENLRVLKETLKTVCRRSGE